MFVLVVLSACNGGTKLVDRSVEPPRDAIVDVGIRLVGTNRWEIGRDGKTRILTERNRGLILPGYSEGGTEEGIVLHNVTRGSVLELSLIHI